MEHPKSKSTEDSRDVSPCTYDTQNNFADCVPSGAKPTDGRRFFANRPLSVSLNGTEIEAGQLVNCTLVVQPTGDRMHAFISDTDDECNEGAKANAASAL